MYKFQIYSVLALFLSSLWIGGCSKNEEPPVIEEPQDTVVVSPPPDSSNIYFDTLTIAQVQQLLQGKWKIEQNCWSGLAEINCTESGKEYLEFVGTDTLRFIKDSVVNDYEILEWGESKGESRGKYLSINYAWGSFIELTAFWIYGIFDSKLAIFALPYGSSDTGRSWSTVREE